MNPETSLAVVALPHVLVVDDDPGHPQRCWRITSPRTTCASPRVASGRAMLEVFETERSTWCCWMCACPARTASLLAQTLRERASVPDHAPDRQRRRGRPRDGPRARRRRLRHQAFQPARAAGPHPRRAAPVQDTVRSARRATRKRRAYRFAGWELNLRTRKLSAPDGRKLDLSNGEFSLLAAFCGSRRSGCCRATS